MVLCQYHDESNYAAIENALTSSGFEFLEDWKERAALCDISSHLEFLTTNRSDEFKQTRIEKIDDFLKFFN